MTKRIVIDPVSRIEGHAKISIFLDDAGEVSDARFHVTEFRGFERFCVGRPFWEMAGLSARICGICPVSHLIASAKAGDQIIAVRIPPAAEKLRRMMNLGQIVQSHALSFFHLSGPDLLLGWDADPAKRNLFGLIAAEPDFARAGIRLRQFGQEVIESLGGKRIHPAWAVPGGVREALSLERRDYLRERLPESRRTALAGLERIKKILDTHQEEIETFGNFSSLFLGLVRPDGTWEHYDGVLRFVDSAGKIVADNIDPARYTEYIGESGEHDSYLKSPFYRPLGYPDGVYRVGPLARLNIASQMGVPLADREHAEFRHSAGGTANASFFFHYARLIEILAATEYIERLLVDPLVTSDRLRAEAGVNQLEAVGVSEAPRGTLFHHYNVDENGLLTRVNLIIATGQNNLAMNRTVAQIAKHYVHGANIPEGMLNRVEAGIRAFDPCLSCSTHAAGTMPLIVRLFAADGTVLQEVRREQTMFLVIGYGNELRRDDGVGPRIARAIAEWDIPGVCALSVQQLTPELAEVIARAEEVVFVDAAVDGDTASVTFEPVLPTWSSPLTNHVSSPPALLELAEVLYGRRPIAWLLTVPARDLDYGEGLSSATEKDAIHTLHTIRLWIDQEAAHA